MRMGFPVAVTVDIHPNDNSESIQKCHEFLSERNIPATFLISTIILERSEERVAIKYIGAGSHELGTHAHYHDSNEIRSLSYGKKCHLDFLRISKESFEDSLGYSPISFRSPTWCGLGSPAREELASLGYRVDCSSTPQRPGILSSYPLENPWLIADRRPTWLKEGLLEVPTSTFFLPLASPSFSLLRRHGSLALLSLLSIEANRSKKKVLVLHFDIQDFNSERAFPKTLKSWRQLIPSCTGGLQWRYWLRTYDPKEIFRTTLAVFQKLEGTGANFVRLSDIYAAGQGV